MRYWRVSLILNYLYQEYCAYSVAYNLTYAWNFGVLAFIFLTCQILTGIFLAMYYNPSTEYAFISIEVLVRNVNYGWLIRYLHSNGASFFFFSVYIHMLRNLIYSAYIKPREGVWVIGMLIFVLMILTAFLGYVLPWGQMSFWAATVITNLFSVIPIYGSSIVVWLWGGFAVGGATLSRFFSFHYISPFLILALVFFHVLALHSVGSSNPLGISISWDEIRFIPYYLFKDLTGVVPSILFFLIFICFVPDFLSHTDNYIPANPLVTPTHIVPEWYFLPFYAILRSIPNKVGGIVLLIFTLILLFLLPYSIFYQFRNVTFNVLAQISAGLFGVIYCILGWLGGNPIEFPYVTVSQFFTLGLFFFLMIGIDMIGIFYAWFFYLYIRHWQYRKQYKQYTYIYDEYLFKQLIAYKRYNKDLIDLVRDDSDIFTITSSEDTWTTDTDVLDKMAKDARDSKILETKKENNGKHSKYTTSE